MYILGGDQTIAMQVVANTPFEERMATAFNTGAVISGNSAGAAVESLNMIGGYTGNNGPENGFQQGSVDLWQPGGPDPNRRGLIFGMTSAVLDQHEFQRGRIARLINTSFTTGLLGIGADADTGVAITDEATLTDVTGATAAIIIDLQTYNATGHFAGPTNSLAIHGVTTHLIPPGGFGYDITHRRPLADGHPLPSPTITGRSFDALHLPAGSGPLILSGDVRSDLSGSATHRFVTVGGGQSARLVVLTFGYAKNTDAQAAALGQAISTDATPTAAGLEDDSSGDFLFSGVTIQPGLNWIPGIAIEPRMVMDRHWGRVYNHLHRNHGLLGLGVDVNTAIEFTATGAKVWGKNTVVVFDGRYGTYALGTNGALSERYILLDTYVEGEAITP
jgi:cyanophycinase